MKNIILFYILLALFSTQGFSFGANISKKINQNNKNYEKVSKELETTKEKEKKLDRQLETTKCTVKNSKKKSNLPLCKDSTTFSRNTTTYKNNKILKVYSPENEPLLEIPIIAETNTKSDKGKDLNSNGFNKRTKEYKASYDHKVDEKLKVGIGLNHKDKEIRQNIAQTKHKKNIDDNNVSVNTEYEKNGIIYKGKVEYGTGHSYKKGIKNNTPSSHYDYINSKGNISVKKDLGNNIELVPSAGVEWKNINEKMASKNGKSYSSNSDSDVIASTGVKLQQKYNDKIRWEIGTEYKQNMKNVFSDKGNYNKTLNNDTYKHRTLVTGGNVKYEKNDSLTYKFGYNFEKNRLYNNHVINFGVIYQLKDQ
ncbi:autotransporter outer membrane beta-barrel domain-containing protein [Leptotrichia sp. OH3620_COT-345]|uniref:autotransporter outer membrane beta-barrel domain-containing protein n=1 Tax=Leptotrichia sp. OH3620_COT-345 TaxID=2491048 RepID=UPI000F64F888|nr:autotransporter outer membrane beta-barrel domain-containing protein [Leptotrichia sp. OH3620_COT-345]RRD40908.1 autotransporter outer membrane beta-barrel domain-containing protein [Leptotrichia sp. OH3620_COT-345]